MGNDNQGRWSEGRHETNYADVPRRVDAGDWVKRDADTMAAKGWDLVSFAVCQHMSGDGTPLPGAAVWAVYRRSS